MKVFLLANQPERTTRLQLFGKTLAGLGHEVVVPRFTSTNWLTIAHEAKQQIKKIKPDTVQIFNVPDVIYKGIPNLKGKYYQKLFYDYRSPWGIELSEYVGWCGKVFGEHHERHLIKNADRITTPNCALGDKILDYKKIPSIIPNYPEKEFTPKYNKNGYGALFVGRLSRLEGAQNLFDIAMSIDPAPMRVVGDGPLYREIMRELGPNGKHWFVNNLRLAGWVNHKSLATDIEFSQVCVVPREENALTPYATDKSVWKVNEFLNAGKIVVASGITKETDRKNLVIVRRRIIGDVVKKSLSLEPTPLDPSDYHYWEDNKELIKAVYE